MNLIDFFGRVVIDKPTEIIKCDKCIFTIVSPGYEDLLDDMLLSVTVNGNVNDALIAVFVVNPDVSCLEIIRKYNAYPIICHTNRETNIDIKSVVYNIVDLVDCVKFLYLDSDVLVLEDLSPIFMVLENLPDDIVCMAHDQYFGWASNLAEAYTGTLYDGSIRHFDDLLGGDSTIEQRYSNVINAGVFAANRDGIKKMRDTVLSFNGLQEWAKEGFIREQFVINLSLAKNQNLSLLNIKYNWQEALRTVFRYENENGKLKLHVGYNPFFLDHIQDPVRILLMLSDKDNPMSARLLECIDIKYYLTFLENIKSVQCSRLEFVKVIEDIFNSLIIKLDLFNDSFLNKFHPFYSNISIDSVPENYSRVRINKEIINRYYISIEERRKEDYIDAPISILHFNGRNKNYSCVRTYIKDNMLLSKDGISTNTFNDIKIAISTHKNYESLTLPSLINSLVKVNGIKKEDILVVSGGWDKADSIVKNGVLHHNVVHNSFDHNAIVDILDNNLENPYWFIMQDTCNVGPDFLDKLLNFDRSYDYVTVDGQGFLNMGLFSWNFIKSNAHYISLLKNCGKERAMLSEKVFLGFGNTTSFGDTYPLFVGYSDVYKTNTLRNICYYPSIDFYKYQANMTDAMRICNP